MFGLSNPCVTRHSNSLVISESLGAVWDVDSLRYPSQHFVDDISVPMGVGAVASVRHPCSSSLVISESLGGVRAVESLRDT